jgi:23S rRNA (cytidine1920-2'-O)/16S rRNA (cytidine1409-2'-O)-methyltransferase
VARRRLDAELVRRGLVDGPQQARELVRAGLVSVGGAPTSNPATLVAGDEPVLLATPGRPYASRAGGKLDAALERFGVDVAGLDCLDAGASTGGFTDRLLRAGARRVAAVDVGYGQLAWRLRIDPRVTVLERTNVRDLTAELVGFRPDLVTVDLSFMSVRTALPVLLEVSAPDARLVILVKPQFEVGRRVVGKGGVVRDPAEWRRVLAEVAEVAARLGAPAQAAMASPLLGPAGNVEFLLALGRGGRAAADLDAAVAEGERVRRR